MERNLNRLDCLELRVHLCDKAVKCTQLCEHCKKPCAAGTLYRQKYLHRAMPHKLKPLWMQIEEVPHDYGIYNNPRLVAFTQAYLENRLWGAPRIELVKRLSKYEVGSVRELEEIWNDMRAMMHNCADYHKWRWVQEYDLSIKLKALRKLNAEEQALFLMQFFNVWEEVLLENGTLNHLMKRLNCGVARIEQQYARGKSTLIKRRKVWREWQADTEWLLKQPEMPLESQGGQP